MKAFIVLFSILFLSACAVSNETAEVPSLSDYLDGTYAVDDRIVIGSQPPVGALEDLRDGGFSTVINFRTRAEMEGLDFDQSALLADAGVAYHEIGIGGQDAYTPEKLARFNALMEASGTEQILLHCRSGTRASHLYAAWLVKYRGLSPDEALERVSPSGWWPMPMEQLLGQPLSVSVEES